MESKRRYFFEVFGGFAISLFLMASRVAVFVKKSCFCMKICAISAPTLHGVSGNMFCLFGYMCKHLSNTFA